MLKNSVSMKKFLLRPMGISRYELYGFKGNKLFASNEVPTQVYCRQYSKNAYRSNKTPPSNANNLQLRTQKMCYGINILEKGEAGFVELFGKPIRDAKPGLNLTIPFLEKLRVVSVREVSINIDPQSSVTRDNVQVSTAGSLHFKVTDPSKACYETYDLMTSIISHAQSSMRSAVGSMELDTLFHDRSSLNQRILDSIQEAAKVWGVDILRYEITDVTPDERVSEAMDSQSIAERKRRETALNADAQRHRDITVSEGARIAVVNESEANKTKVVLAAQAEAESTVLKANAEAQSIEIVGKALKDNPQTAQFLLAKQYLDNVAHMLPKSTVFMSKDIGDVSKLVAVATSINETLKQ